MDASVENADLMRQGSQSAKLTVNRLGRRNRWVGKPSAYLHHDSVNECNRLFTAATSYQMHAATSTALPNDRELFTLI
jgi:hypothetical protein